jgi:hypothetical protein
MTIEPLVSGQQLMEPLEEGGRAISVSSRLEGHSDEAAECFDDLCFALQHACASMDADMAIDGSGAVISLAAVRA